MAAETKSKRRFADALKFKALFNRYIILFDFRLLLVNAQTDLLFN